MKKFFLIFICFFTPGIIFAGQAEDEFLANIESIKTYNASFEQIIRDDVGKVISKSKGLMLVQRPNKFYWQTNQPDPIKVVADGKTLWSYDIDLEQVTKQSLKKAIQNTPAAILAGDVNEFRQNFEVEYAKQGQCSIGNNCYSLKSTDDEPIFSNMIMSMDKNKLLEIHMTDQLGQNVVTKFTNVKVNSPVNEAKFRFSPPKDIDVVEMGQQ